MPVISELRVGYMPVISELRVGYMPVISELRVAVSINRGSLLERALMGGAADPLQGGGQPHQGTPEFTNYRSSSVHAVSLEKFCRDLV